MPGSPRTTSARPWPIRTSATNRSSTARSLNRPVRPGAGPLSPECALTGPMLYTNPADGTPACGTLTPPCGLPYYRRGPERGPGRPWRAATKRAGGAGLTADVYALLRESGVGDNGQVGAER